MIDCLHTLAATIRRFSGSAHEYDHFRPQPPQRLRLCSRRTTGIKRPALVVNLGGGTGLNARPLRLTVASGRLRSVFDGFRFLTADPSGGERTRANCSGSACCCYPLRLQPEIVLSRYLPGGNLGGNRRPDFLTR
jgi:hypothetical protein